MAGAATKSGLEDDAVPLSALQHYLFCPRQCALIHVERAWAENALTAEGRLAHEAVHAPKDERRRGVRVVTGMPLRSQALGLAGIADAVELHDTPSGRRPFPVEHKLGRPKAHRADEVQLCAQALCLEEMLGCEVPAGALFYGRTRRRKEVAFDAELRDLTIRVARAVSELLATGRTPPAVHEPGRCDACSLRELCRPKALERPRRVEAWLARLIEEDG
ncbi:CRISPR-associated protein Cas4 [Marinimicrococcus flavescens]|uniref:CRISPR-associated exonuclease Cas4 n=1 Tax=Marinimicrococcus flavescens TaxID=3031815 RepID=A0AAP3XSP4_9PROT|nr:CRISPR-associated protein Cas4 [Marinimicrococcus flavescens]